MVMSMDHQVSLPTTLRLLFEMGGQIKVQPFISKTTRDIMRRLFLGDFNKDNITDIMVSIDTGGSGGYGIFYIYSFKNNILHELFNVDKYNAKYLFQVNYADFYKVHVESHSLIGCSLLTLATKALIIIAVLRCQRTT